MKRLSETNYRLLYRWSLILKGLISIGELAAGFLLLFVSYATLAAIVSSWFGGELAETPPDIMWAAIMNGIRGFTATPRETWSFIFISHGIVKVFLIWGLLKEKMWAYPWGAGIFVFFIIYQIYQMTFTLSLALLFITILDIGVVALILHEYRWKLKHRAASA